MNREQRRRHAKEITAKQAAQAPRTFQTKYAISETHVIVVFPYPVPNIQMTPAQVDDMIAQLRTGQKALAERQAAAWKAANG